MERAQPDDQRIHVAQKELADAKKSKLSKYAELVIGRPGLGASLLYELVTLVSAWVPGALGLFLRSKLYPLLLGACGRNVTFGQNVVLRHPHKIRIGANVVVDDNVLLDAKGVDNEGIRARRRRLHRPQHDSLLQERDDPSRRARQHRLQLRDLHRRPGAGGQGRHARRLRLPRRRRPHARPASISRSRSRGASGCPSRSATVPGSGPTRSWPAVSRSAPHAIIGAGAVVLEQRPRLPHRRGRPRENRTRSEESNKNPNVWEQAPTSGKLLKSSLPSLPADFLKTQVVGRFKAIPPTVLIFNVSYKCDSKCVMCNSWKLPYHDDLTTEEYRRSVLERAVPLDRVRRHHRGRAHAPQGHGRHRPHDGGRTCRNLRKMTLNTNGFVKDRVVKTLDQIIDVANEHGFVFGTRVSLDGVGDAHEDIRRVWHAFERAMDTVREMQELQKKKFFNFGVSFTFTAQNLEEGERHLRAVQERGPERRLLHRALLGARVRQHGSDGVHRAQEGRLSRSSRISFRKRVRESAIVDGDALLYQAYVKMFQNGMKRTMPCPSMDQGMLLNPNGDLTYCENSRVIGNVRESDPKALYFDPKNLAMRQEVLDKSLSELREPLLRQLGRHETGVSLHEVRDRARLREARRALQRTLTPCAASPESSRKTATRLLDPARHRLDGRTAPPPRPRRHRRSSRSPASRSG